MPKPATKRCPNCEKVKPRTPRFWGIDRYTKDGLRYRCIDCFRKSDALSKRKIYHRHREGRTLEDDLREHRDREQELRDRSRHKEALQRIRVLEAEREAWRRLSSAPSAAEIVPRHNDKEFHEATAIACLSDVHIGARVRPAQVNRLNEYSIDTARYRCSRFFERVVRMTQKERQGVQIDELVLFLGGDLIDGALHLDTIMSNEVAEPMQQAVICQEIVDSGLRYIEKHGKFKRVTVVCKDGNHGRITHKMHHASRIGNSIEWLIYNQLKARFPKMNWIIEESLHSFVSVYGTTIRFHHGDTIGFGGTNGFYTYLNRRRYQWNSARKADIDVLGHLHQYTATKRWVVNGSVVGYSPFAISIGAEYERPMQAFFLIDKKRGMTVNIPIYLD